MKIIIPGIIITIISGFLQFASYSEMLTFTLASDIQSLYQLTAFINAAITVGSSFVCHGLPSFPWAIVQTPGILPGRWRLNWLFTPAATGYYAIRA